MKFFTARTSVFLIPNKTETHIWLMNQNHVARAYISKAQEDESYKEIPVGVILDMGSLGWEDCS
ncbi:hypothetical protein OSB04_000989 [Centaurea solstitialis]|uniref:Uncharacterized protein n=1 Tax=Centaurea solstitialis TaxID=347529 RepID=A0AA38TXN3_9ASTR|nr:hypothetical protein OSB04_000989 [Centaurea solstitialis]